jgi:Uma2 family endonuclease
MDHVTHRPATMADLAALPETVKGEILDGVLYTQPRPRAQHLLVESIAAADILTPFHRGRGGPGGWWIIIEPGIEIPRATEFSPDIAGWRRSILPEVPMAGPFRTVPQWICEVLSPSNRAYDLRVKRRFYAEIGVEHLWYIDPESHTLAVSRLHEGHWLELGVHGDTDRVRAEPFEAIEIDLAGWWPTSST